ncbi:MAG: nucleotide sugar dehydrogenase, partial [Sphingobacteriales bacterium]
MTLKLDPDNTHIAVIGLGYVGLPLAVEFARKFKVTGFDVNASRIQELNAGYDKTREVDSDLLSMVLNGMGGMGLTLTGDDDAIDSANIFIVTVPTPVDKYNRPNLTPLYKASETVG